MTEIMTLFNNEKVFDYPKPTTLITRLIKYGYLNDNDIIMDFFSGSGTTAHATFLYNKEEKKNVKFILIQMPEDLDSNLQTAANDAKKSMRFAIQVLDSINKSHFLTEIAKERIRRAGKKIKEEAGLEAQNLDTGFRVFKCEDSFMNNVYFSPNDLSQADLFSQVSNIKDGTSDLSLLFGCMLDWGVQLSLPLTSFEVSGKTIYNVNDGDLVACFAEDVNEEVITAIAELIPLRVVFRDSCFSDAPLKMNLFELFKQKCGWSEEVVKNRVHVI